MHKRTGRKRGGGYISIQTLLDLGVLVVRFLARLDGESLVRMGLRGLDVLLDGLDARLVVVLVDFAVDGGGDLLA